MFNNTYRMKKMKDEKERDLFFVGDIHGEFKALVWKLTQQYRVTDANVVILGDCGIGFGKIQYYKDLFKKLSEKLENSNIVLYMVRGNHDNKDFWTSPDLDLSSLFPRFKFLRDHEVIELSGKAIYPIGGAHSLDRDWRQKYNSLMESVGSSKRIWWPSEVIEKKYKDIPIKVDIIASHQAPLSFEPILLRDREMSKEMFEDILDERKYLDYIFQNVRCKYWFFGHHHCSVTSSVGNVVYKCLGIEELYQLREIKEGNNE